MKYSFTTRHLRGLAALLLLPLASIAQAPAWSRAQKIGGTNAPAPSTSYGTIGLATAVDAQGSQYVSGSFLDPVLTLGTTTLTNADPSGNTEDVFVAKYGPDGAVVWAVRFGGPGDQAATGLAVDPAGNVYVAGYFNNTLAVGSTPLVSAGGNDVLLLKLNAQGVPQWAFRSGGPLDDIAADDTGYPQVVLGTGTGGAAGPVWLGATFGGTATLSGTPTTLTSAGGLDQLLVELNPATGAVVRPDRLGGTADDVLTRMAVDPANNLYVGGISTSPTLTVGTTALPHRSQAYDGYVVKYNAQLAPQWATSEGAAGPNTEVNIYGLTVTPAGSVTITGAGAGNIPVGSLGTIPINASGTTVYYVPFAIRYSPQGQPVALSSGRSVGGGGIMNGLARDAAGNAYAMGFFAGALTWGNVTLQGNSAAASLFVIKLDATTLAPQWAVRPTPGPNSVAFGLDIAVDAAANCYLTGSYFGSMTFGALPTLAASVTPATQAGFVAKLGAAPLAVRASVVAVPLEAWPNPVGAGQALHLARPRPGEPGVLRLFDVTGRLVAALPLAPAAQQVALPPTLAPGRYLAEMAAANQLLRQVLLVE